MGRPSHTLTVDCSPPWQAVLTVSLAGSRVSQRSYSTLPPEGKIDDIRSSPSRVQWKNLLILGFCGGSETATLDSVGPLQMALDQRPAGPPPAASRAALTLPIRGHFTCSDFSMFTHSVQAVFLFLSGVEQWKMEARQCFWERHTRCMVCRTMRSGLFLFKHPLSPRSSINSISVRN